MNVGPGTAEMYIAKELRGIKKAMWNTWLL